MWLANGTKMNKRYSARIQKQIIDLYLWWQTSLRARRRIWLNRANNLQVEENLRTYY